MIDNTLSQNAVSADESLVSGYKATKPTLASTSTSTSSSASSSLLTAVDRSFRALYNTIDGAMSPVSGDGTGISSVSCGEDHKIQHLRDILLSKNDALKQGLRYFTRQSPTSANKLKTAMGEDPLCQGTGGPSKTAQIEFSLSVSSMLDLDEILTRDLLINFSAVEWSAGGGYAGSFDVTDISRDAILAFYLEERLSLVMCIGSLIRNSADANSPVQEIVTETLDSVTDSFLLNSLLRQFTDSCLCAIPPASSFGPGLTDTQVELWATHVLSEQFEVLDVIFLLLYARPSPSPASVVSLLESLESTQFGEKQANAHLFSATAATSLISRVARMCALVAIEALGPEAGLEQFASSNREEDQDKNRRNGSSTLTVICVPQYASKVDELLDKWGNRVAHGPVLLVWSALRALSSPSTAEGFQQYILSLLSSSEMVTILPALCVPSEGLDDGMLTPYKSMMSTVLYLTLNAINVNTISRENYTVLLTLSEMIFTGQALLCQQFWFHDAHDPHRRSLLDFARSRFPRELVPYLRLCTSLSCGMESANAAFKYLAQLPSITTAISIDAAQSLRAYASSDDDGDITTNVTSHAPICIFDSQIWGGSLNSKTGFPYMTLGVGARGIMLPASPLSSNTSDISNIDEGPCIVQWATSGASAWHVCMLVLDAFIASPASALPTLALEGCSSDASTAVVEVLRLIRAIISTSAKLTYLLEQHFQDLIETLSGSRNISFSPARGNDKISCDVLLPRLMAVLQRFRPAGQQHCDGESSSSPGLGVSASVMPIHLLALETVLDCTSAIAKCFPSAVRRSIKHAGIVPAGGGGGRYLGEGWSGGAGMQIGGIPAAAMGFLPAVLESAELARGTYPVTLAFLRLGLVVMRGATSEALCTEDNDQPLDVADLLAWVATFEYVFAFYEHWRFQRIAERYELGCVILEVVLVVMRAPPSMATVAGKSDTGTVPEVVVGGLADQMPKPSGPVADTLALRFKSVESAKIELFTSFLSLPTLHTPLLNILATGAWAVEAMFVMHRRLEGDRLERLKALALDTLSILIMHRALVPSSPLELSLLTRTCGRSARGERLLVAAIASMVQYPYCTEIPLSAVRVLRQLCGVASAQPHTPSMLSCFGDGAEILRDKFVARLLNAEEEPELRVELLLFIAVLVETQPGLAACFIDLQPRVANATDSKGSTNVFTISDNSCLHAVSLVLSNVRKYMLADPAMVAASLGLLHALWKSAPDHATVLDTVRQWPGFWTSIASIFPSDLTMPVADATRLNVSGGERLTDTTDVNESGVFVEDSVAADCFRARSAGLALSIVSLELFFVMRTPKGSDSKLDTDLVSLLKKLYADGSIASWLTMFPRIIAGSDLRDKLKQRAAQCIGIDLDDFLTVSTTHSVGLDFVYNANALAEALGVEDSDETSSDTSKKIVGYNCNDLMDPRVDVVSMMRRSNAFWSLADSRIFLIRCVRQFIEISVARQADALGLTRQNTLEGPHTPSPIYKVIVAVAEEVYSSCCCFNKESISQEDKDTNMDTDSSYLDFDVPTATELALLLLHLLGQQPRIALTLAGSRAILRPIVAALPAVKEYSSVAPDLLAPLVTAITFVLQAMPSSVPRASEFSKSKSILKRTSPSPSPSQSVGDESTSNSVQLAEDWRFVEDVVIQLVTLVTDILSDIFVLTPLPLLASENGEHGNMQSGSSQAIPPNYGVTVALMALATQLFHRGISSSTTWLSALSRHQLLPVILKAVRKCLETTSHIEFTSSALHLILSLLRDPSAALILRSAGIINLLTACRGIIDLRGKFEPYDAITGSPSPWHRVWVLLIDIASEGMRSLSFDGAGFVDEALDFAEAYHVRLLRAMHHVIDCPPFPLTLATLEEAGAAADFSYGLAVHKARWRYALSDQYNELSVSCLLLFQRCVFLLRHPQELHRLAMPVSRVEKERFTTCSSSSLSSSSLKGATERQSTLDSQGEHIASKNETAKLDSEFFANIERALFAVLRVCISTIRLLSPDVFSDDSVVDPAASQPLFTSLFNEASIQDAPSFSTLMSCITLCVTMMKDFSAGSHSSSPRSQSFNTSKSHHSNNIRCSSEGSPFVESATISGVSRRSRRIVASTDIYFVLENTLAVTLSHAIYYQSIWSAPTKNPEDASICFKLRARLAHELNEELIPLLAHVDVNNAKHDDVPLKTPTLPSNKVRSIFSSMENLENAESTNSSNSAIPSSRHVTWATDLKKIKQTDQDEDIIDLKADDLVSLTRKFARNYFRMSRSTR